MVAVDRPPAVAGNLACVLRPTPRFRHQLALIHGSIKHATIEQAVQDATAVDALARLLTEGQRPKSAGGVAREDGLVDSRDLAAFVLGRMAEHRR